MAIRDTDLDGQPAPERALIERFAQTKDPETFSALVTSTRPWLVSTCTRILGGDRYTAEDVAQECYVKAFGFLANGGSPIDFRAWLFAVARNACIDEIRKVHTVPVDEVPERAVTDDEIGLDAPLETAWTSLEPRQRALIFMREFLGMSYREIADQTETSLPAVETALFRARSSLRRQYRRAGGTISGLAWLGFGLRGIFRSRRSGSLTRLTASIQDRVNAVMARLPGSNPGEILASAASLTAVGVIAGLIAWSPGSAVAGAGGEQTARASAVASAPSSHSDAGQQAQKRHKDASSGTPSTPTGPSAGSSAGEDVTRGLGSQGVQQVSSDTAAAAGQVVQSATDTIKKATDAVKKTADDATKTVSNTVSDVTCKSATGSIVPCLPGP